MPEIRLKLLPASENLRIARETLRKRLIALKAQPDEEGAYGLYDLFRAALGDANAERLRGLSLDNDLKEIELSERRGEMMDTASAMAIFNAWALPVRQKLLALESEMKHRCNPVDPDLAGVALKEWTVQAMRLIQTELKRVAVETNAAETNAIREPS